MTHAGTAPPPAAPLRYTLELQPETAAQPWRAVLRPAGAGVDPAAPDDALVFDTPLALARHLAQFMAPPRRYGLR
jgi:hypothetical protein